MCCRLCLPRRGVNTAVGRLSPAWPGVFTEQRPGGQEAAALAVQASARLCTHAWLLAVPQVWLPLSVWHPHPFQVGRDCTGSSSVRPLTTSFFAVRGASVGPLPRRAFGRQRWRETVFHPSPRVFSFLLSEAAACSGPHVRSSPLSFSSTSAGLVSRSAPPGVCHDWRPSASLKLALSELVLSPSLSLGKVQSLTLCRLPFR